MASTYSTNLALELIGTGDQSGTWGTTTNTNLGTLIEQAISGYVTQAITDGADTTITIPNGATGVARNMFIEMTGALTAARNLIVPANKKLYFIYNNTTGGYAVTVKVSGQTGVSVPNGSKVVLVCNGTDIVAATTYLTSLSLGSALSVANGGTGASTFTSGALLKGAGTSAITTATAGTDYAKPDTASTWSANQTFGDGYFKMSGASSGTMTVKAPAAASTYTITFPAATTTIAGLGLAQTYTVSQRGTVTTDNDLSFDMSVTNNFLCTPTAGGTLTFTNITAGQSGNIILVNGSNYAITAAAATKVSSTTLATISTTGTYWLSYYSPDGTSVYVSNTGALS
jgi:hypothetical protein